MAEDFGCFGEEFVSNFAFYRVGKEPKFRSPLRLGGLFVEPPPNPSFKRTCLRQAA